jgi:hypothetical protein
MRVGARLSFPQRRVLAAVLEGHRSLSEIAHATGSGARTVQHTLDALTRRSMVTPVDFAGACIYQPTDRAWRTLRAQ